MPATWMTSIDEQELFSLCPELKKIDQAKLIDPDDAIELVREMKAIRIHYPELPRTMYPTRDPYEFNKLRQSRRYEIKDYKQEDVKKLDETKKKYWAMVKDEIRLLVCTRDKKYTVLRKQIREAIKHSQAPVVAMISATLASSMGVAVGVISGLVAVAIFAIVKIGTNAYCATIS